MKTDKNHRLFILLFSAICLIGCSSENNKATIGLSQGNTSQALFKSVPGSKSKISFKNIVTDSRAMNFVNYLYAYNGGGVAIGDINNDGLDDIYFSANQGSNKLYLNKGGLSFEDITKSSKTALKTGWKTGVTMVDINNDGMLDIYVCRSGSVSNPETRKNELLINQGNNTFLNEAAEYGLDFNGFSVQAYFLDYDKDGDLDLFLVNHRADFKNTSIINLKDHSQIVEEFSDKLYRNDGNRFTDISVSAGIANKAWGLSASISDFNGDGWVDIYVCNDFMHPDHLWINDQKGGFTDEILSTMDHISFYSMGSDIADINNDGLNDLIVLDMVSEDHIRSKINMPGMNPRRFQVMTENDYHHQYMFNSLQLNRGQGNYSEIGHMAGIAKTDWSWSPILQDFDNDGYKDLYITNGIKVDMTNNDWKNKLDVMNADGHLKLSEVLAQAPGSKLSNYVFKNNGNLGFEKMNKTWGLDQKYNSNGCATSDLDNDGDLDLVVNNLDDFASIYENQSSNNYLKINLKGSNLNTSGLGAKITINTENNTQHYTQYLSRGFQSSISPTINIGMGNESKITNLIIEWPDGKTETKENLKANKTITLKYEDASPRNNSIKQKDQWFKEVPVNIYSLDHTHSENEYNDFQTEVLLPYKLSTQGPNVTKGDFNNDGLEDIYIGGTLGNSPLLLKQNTQGKFELTQEEFWKNQSKYEDIQSHFFDADMDGDMDLYVVSGGNEKSLLSNELLQDRLYINTNGVFKKSNKALPNLNTSGSFVQSADYDNDGDLDILVGGRLIPGKYPIPATSAILENDKGVFKNVTQQIAPDLVDIGLVTDGLFSDYDNDGDLDIFLVGEWMGLKVLKNEDGIFKVNDQSEVTGKGWWYSINASDLDNDGDDDYVLGNLGENNKFGAKENIPFHVFCDDFDNTGTLDIVLSKESNGKLLPLRGKECSSEQMPFIKEKFPTFESFAYADLNGIYGDLSSALHYETTNFSSIVLLNKNGKFTAKKLPIECQIGPTLNTLIRDVNGDQHLDIIGAGNIYNAEIETTRFDASKGYTLLGDGKGNFTHSSHSGFLHSGNVKDLINLSIQNEEYILVLKNNEQPQLYELLNI